MTALTLNHEFGLMRVRFRRTLAISAGLHVLFFGWLMVNRQWTPINEPVVEITWLDQALPPAAVEMKPEPTQIKPVIVKTELSVKEKLAQNTPVESVRDKMNSLQPSAEVAQALSVAPSSAADLLNTSLATMAPVVRRESPVHLNRGGGAHEPAVALTRGATSSSNTATPVAALAGTPSLNEKSQLQSASGAVVNLGGATLSGLVADRQVLAHTMPIYPAWATSEAAEATVTLYFLVLASGQVKENVQIQKTGGAADFDRNAVAAIRQWRFEALSGQTTREQWGTITFRYRLNN